MTEALAVLQREFESVTGRALGDPSANILDLGLDSISVLSLVSRLRANGYAVPMEEMLATENMSELAEIMTAFRC